MTPDEEEAPAASRPAPVEEVQPLGRDGRHCGSSYELVLDATVPQLGVEVDVPGKFTTELAGRLRAFLQALDPGEGGGGGQGIAQEIPEVQVPRRRRVKQRTVRFEDVPVPHVPQERISERIQEQIVDALESQGIPQKRISKRIVDQIVPLPQDIPQERTSERIVEQIVPAPQVIPQKRTSKRIAEQVVDAGMGTSSSSAAALGAAECPNDGVFRTFPRKKKSATSGPESSANLVSHSSSWPSAAYAVPMVSEVAAPVLEVDSEDEDPNRWRDELGRLWVRSLHNPRKWYLLGTGLDVAPSWEEPG